MFMKKDYFNLKKSKLLLLMLLTMIVGVSPAWADEVTIYSGTATSAYTPVQGNYADTNGSISEFILPASALSDLNGGTISKMTFYVQTPPATAWTATFTVYMKEIEEIICDVSCKIVPRVGKYIPIKKEENELLNTLPTSCKRIMASSYHPLEAITSALFFMP